MRAIILDKFGGPDSLVYEGIPEPVPKAGHVVIQITPGFPLSDVPLQKIAADAASGRLDVKPVRIFRFDEVREAHRVIKANEAHGKMVVVHD
jgi:NADPH:quinone reductase-like Zn-dependent oxidoreductase